MMVTILDVRIHWSEYFVVSMISSKTPQRSQYLIHKKLRLRLSLWEQAENNMMMISIEVTIPFIFTQRSSVPQTCFCCEEVFK